MGPEKKTIVGLLCILFMLLCTVLLKNLFVLLHAQAQMKLKAWDTALASLKQVLKIEPNNEKALFRSLPACSPIITRLLADH